MKLNRLSHILISVAFLLYTTSCDEREMNNPFDVNCSKEVFTPSGLNAEQIEEIIRLSWEQDNVNISGFIINRNENDGVMEEVARIDKANSIWDDADIEGGNKYGYQLIAYAGENLSNPQEVYLTAESTSSNTITDYDGNIYNTISIGEQIWLQENLKVTHYADGTPITLVEDQSAWDALSNSDRAYCWYDNDINNGDIYGALYTWAAASNGLSSNTNPSGVQGACPSGWHLPSDEEWKQLEVYLGMSQAEANMTGYRGSDEGGKLKEDGTLHWWSPNTGATNESGFTGLPGGARNDLGQYYDLGEYGKYWTSTEEIGSDAWRHVLSYNDAKVFRGEFGKKFGLSIRCVKGAEHQSVPTVTTANATSITETTAQSGGNVTDDGGSNVLAKGICWSASPNPTTSDNSTNDGAGTGGFTSAITGLSCGTKYYIRAYASNAVGTAYGEELSFTTTDCTVELPEITTTTVSDITANSAQTGGNVTDDGGTSVTARGVCWSTSSNPTIAQSRTNDGTGTGTFTSTLSGLLCETVYYVRAYATNSSGTAYGNQVSFTTDQCPPEVPTVTTDAISNILETSAQGGGVVTDDGNTEVTARGVCWSTSPSPTTADNFTTNGSGTGNFSSDITGLTANTIYHVRAYATNSAGTGYGNEVSFATIGETITDYDGNVYLTVVIGDQLWMAENLQVTHYSDGTAIPLVENTSFWDALTESERAYCWHDNNPLNANTYGALYTWAAAVNGTGSSDSNPSGIQGVCPSGWHLPSDSEWKQLEIHLGMSQSDADNVGWRGSSEGGALKDTGTEFWNSPNSGATNSSGFTALPGGNRYDYGSFLNVGTIALFWTASEDDGTNSWARSLSYNIAEVYRGNYVKSNGFSIRCVRDL